MTTDSNTEALIAKAQEWADYFEDAPDGHASVAINVPEQRKEIVACLRLASTLTGELAAMTTERDEAKRDVAAFERHKQTLRDNEISSHTEAVVRVQLAESENVKLKAELARMREENKQLKEQIK